MIGKKVLITLSWGDTEVYKKTIGGGYLINDETPWDAYHRVCENCCKTFRTS